MRFQQRKTPKLLSFPPLLRDCWLRDSGPQRSCVRQLTILDVLSFSPFFLLRHLSIFLWEICPKPKKEFERLSRVRPLLCDGRVEVSTTARTKTTTVVNRTCELIRNQIFSSSRTNGKKRRENTERRAERGVQKRQKESAERIHTSPVYTQFRRFRRAKKRRRSRRRPFLLFLVFFPLNS